MAVPERFEPNILPMHAQQHEGSGSLTAWMPRAWAIPGPHRQCPPAEANLGPSAHPLTVGNNQQDGMGGSRQLQAPIGPWLRECSAPWHVDAELGPAAVRLSVSE